MEKIFQDGGFWAMNSADEKILLEDVVNVGDMGAGYARIIHGVIKSKEISCIGGF